MRTVQTRRFASWIGRGENGFSTSELRSGACCTNERAIVALPPSSQPTTGDRKERHGDCLSLLASAVTDCVRFTLRAGKATLLDERSTGAWCHWPGGRTCLEITGQFAGSRLRLEKKHGGASCDKTKSAVTFEAPVFFVNGVLVSLLLLLMIPACSWA